MPFVSAWTVNKVNSYPLFASRKVKVKDVPLPPVDITVHDFHFSSAAHREQYVEKKRANLQRLMNPAIWPPEVLSWSRYSDVKEPQAIAQLSQQALRRLTRHLSKITFKDGQPMEPFTYKPLPSSQNDFCETLGLVATRSPDYYGYQATEDVALLKEIAQKKLQNHLAGRQARIAKVKQAMTAHFNPSGSLRMSMTPVGDKQYQVDYEYVSPSGTQIAMEIYPGDAGPICSIQFVDGPKRAYLGTYPGSDNALVTDICRKAAAKFNQILGKAKEQGKLITAVRDGDQFKVVDMPKEAKD